MTGTGWFILALLVCLIAFVSAWFIVALAAMTLLVVVFEL